MSLRVQCPTCGKTLGVPESAAGREGKCNACGSKLVVPKVAAPVAFDPPMAPPPPPPPKLPPVPPPLKSCPFCAELIQPEAKKCRWCGEHLDSKVRASQEKARRSEIEEIKTAIRSPSPFIAMVLSLFIPGLGHLYKGKIWSAFVWFLATAIGYLLIIPGLVLHLACILDSGRDS